MPYFSTEFREAKLGKQPEWAAPQANALRREVKNQRIFSHLFDELAHFLELFCEENALFRVQKKLRCKRKEI